VDLLAIAESDELQMDFFIEALKQNCMGIVEKFMSREIQIDKKFARHLHMARILRLYTQVTFPTLSLFVAVKKRASQWRSG
jgi:hypothetical protein